MYSSIHNHGREELCMEEHAKKYLRTKKSYHKYDEGNIGELQCLSRNVYRERVPSAFNTHSVQIKSAIMSHIIRECVTYIFSTPGDPRKTSDIISAVGGPVFSQLALQTIPMYREAVTAVAEKARACDSFLSEDDTNRFLECISLFEVSLNSRATCSVSFSEKEVETVLDFLARVVSMMLDDAHCGQYMNYVMGKGDSFLGIFSLLLLDRIACSRA